MAINFEDLENCPVIKDYQQLFGRQSVFVVEVEVDNTVHKTSGVSYKDVSFVFADGQRVTMSVKDTGDVWQIKLNGAVLPIKNQDNHGEAVNEIVSAMAAGRAKFQARLARIKAIVPASLKVVRPKLEKRLQDQLAEYDERIANNDKVIKDLNHALGKVELLDDAKWSEGVKPKWRPPKGFFTRSAEDIAKGLKANSRDKAQAVDRLDFYINRDGKNLPAEDRSRLHSAMEKLEASYGNLDDTGNEIPGPGVQVVPNNDPPPGSQVSPTPAPGPEGGVPKNPAPQDKLIPIPPENGQTATDNDLQRESGEGSDGSKVAKPVLDDTATDAIPGPDHTPKPILDDAAASIPNPDLTPTPAALLDDADDGGDVGIEDESLSNETGADGEQNRMDMGEAA